MKRPNYYQALVTLLAIISVYAVLISFIVYFESHDPTANMHGWEDGLWYLLATLTTVGYGDVIPVTYWGRTLGFLVLLSSFGVYGFIIGQIANFMSTLKETREMGLNGSTFKNHVIVIGWNDYARSVIEHLVAAGRQVAVVTKERPSIDIIRESFNTNYVFTLYSDYNNFDLLEKANIRDSSVVFVNLSDDTDKLVYIINIRKHYENLNYVVTLENGNLKSTFQNAGVTYAISKNEISSKLLASYIFEPDVARFSEEILAFAHEDHAYDMKQVLVKKDNPFVGMYYDKAFFDLKKESNVVLIGIVKIEDGKHKLLKNPEGSVKIEADDYLIMLMDNKGQSRLKRMFHIEEGIN